MSDFKSHIIKEVLCAAQNVKKTAERLGNTVINDANDIEIFSQELRKSAEETGKNYRKLIAIGDELGQPVSYAQYSNIEKMLQIKKEGSSYHFILQEALPHRITIDRFTKSLKYDYDTNIYYSGYRAAIEEYMRSETIQHFKRKAVLYVLTHGRRGHMLDNDNIEIKTFIDAAVKGIFVADDGPEYLSIHLDGVADDQGYTEMFLGYPEDIIPTILKKEAEGC